MYVVLYFDKTRAEVTLCLYIQFAMLLLVTRHFPSKFFTTATENE